MEKTIDKYELFRQKLIAKLTGFQEKLDRAKKHFGLKNPAYQAKILEQLKEVQLYISTPTKVYRDKLLPYSEELQRGEFPNILFEEVNQYMTFLRDEHALASAP